MICFAEKFFSLNHASLNHRRGKEEMHGKRFQETLMASKTVNFKDYARVVCERLLNVAISQHIVKTKEQFVASGISPENNLLFFFYHHNNVHQFTSYKYIKSKSSNTRHHRTQNLQRTYTTYCKFCT